MRRILIAALLGLAVLTGTAACGRVPSADAATSFSPEGEALAAMGIDPQDIAAAEPAFGLAGLAVGASPAPSGSAAPGKGDHRADPRRRRALKVLLAKNTLHGEAVVQTKNGTVTVAVQRGVITELTDSTVTVKSTDGYTLTWKLGDQLRVVEKRRTVQPSAVAVGLQVAIAGAKEGDGAVARLLVIPLRQA
ncbi:hypothetical protein [Hamadaea tsunoensis]|uniref:hypothetical protein n=1 Tax=Hamadaea tsunoensis TaxID=53368 RepID=UPI0004861D1F|nr:hypothetical protein [Hamadaea tsunoensis]